MQNIGAWSAVIIGVIVTAGIFLSLSSQIFELLWLVQFKRRLKAAIDLGELTYEDFKNLFAAFAQPRSSALQALRMELCNSLEAGKKDRCTVARKLIDSHIAEEPFSDLPEHIAIQLRDIQAALTSNKTAIPQLAKSLGRLYRKNHAALARERRWAVFGVVVGVLGFLVGVWQLFFVAPPVV